MKRHPRLNDIEKLLKKGLFTRDIAEITRCSMATVNYWIRKDQKLIALRNSNNTIKRKVDRKVSDFYIRTLIERGLSKKQIAAECEVDISTVNRRLKSNSELRTLYEEHSARRLTPKQIRVGARSRLVPDAARLASQGFTAAQIADKLGTTKRRIYALKSEFPEMYRQCLKNAESFTE